jgi:hypothetical protein
VKDVCFGYGIWAGLRWMCMFSLGLGLGFGFGLRGVFLYCVLGFRSFPIFPSIFFSSLLSTGYLGLGGVRAFVCFLFSSALSNWFVHFVWNALGQRGSVGTGFGPMAFVAFGLRLRA